MQLTRNRATNPDLRGRGLFAAIGVLLALASTAVLGCGGGGNTSIFPFAGLWVANSTGQSIMHFTGTQVNVQGISTFPAKTVLHSTLFISPQDLTFDAKGNMWVVDGGLNNGLGTGAAVYEFAQAQLKNLNSQPSPSPVFIVASTRAAPFFNFPQFGIFDSASNLWVSDSGNNEIFKFSAAQLRNPTRLATSPAAALQGTTAGVFDGPLGMAFDAKGNLWVANNAGNTIVEISFAALSVASGPVNPIAPVTTLSNPAGGPLNIDNPWGMLFDTNNNLWFTNEQLDVGKCAGTVTEFSGTLIAGGGTLTPTPTVVLTQTAISSTQSLCDPNGISMTAAVAPAPVGNLSVANAGNSSLAVYVPNQLSGSGNPTPNLFIIGPLMGPTGLTYGPLSLE